MAGCSPHARLLTGEGAVLSLFQAQKSTEEWGAVGWFGWAVWGELTCVKSAAAARRWFLVETEN
jgi:hypothetical protein